MTNYLILILCSILFVNCIELENLCKNGIFIYNGIKVNSIHKINVLAKLAKIDWYSINDEIQLETITDNSLKEKMHALKDE